MVINKYKELSCVMPVYNSGKWLFESLPRLIDSLKEANITKVEIIVVDDGSTDGSTDGILNIPCPYKIKIIKQKNSGRFLARKKGIDESKYRNVLLIDSRVLIDKGSISYIFNSKINSKQMQVWNGHVNIDKEGNIFARFWDALVLIAWRRYFSNPRECSYGLADFDYYPKGTGCFLVPKKIIVKAIDAFLLQTTDLRNSSDDTLLIRIIATNNNINLSPEFSCTYYSRNTFKKYIAHAHVRGRLFVDGFLRPGNRFFVPLIVFLSLCLFVPVLLVLQPHLLGPSIILLIVLWLIELTVSLILIGIKDALSLWILSPIFAIAYGLGIIISSFRIASRLFRGYIAGLNANNPNK